MTAALLGRAPSPMLICSDNSLAATLTLDEEIVGMRLLVASVPQLAFRWSQLDQALCGAAWLPGTHTLLLLGRVRLARLSVASLHSRSPLQLEWSTASRAAGPKEPCMDLLPDGSVAVILQSTGWASSEASYSLAQYETADLAYRTCVRFTLPAGALPATGRAPYDGDKHTSVHCAASAVAVCFGRLGTRVHGLQAGVIGPAIFSAHGLAKVSWSSGYLAGIKDAAVEVLEGCSGRSLMRWQARHGGAVLSASRGGLGRP